MKYIFVITTGLLLGANVYGQEPVFQSPYKNGKPVPESSKDYSKPVPINMLNGGASKQAVAPAANTALVADTKKGSEGKTKPAMQSSTKKQVKN